MRLLQGSIASAPIVQSQHLPHLGFNGKNGCFAATNQTRGTPNMQGAKDRTNLLTGSLDALRRWLRRRREYRRVLQELNAMSSRELAQKGLSREVITRMALEASRKV